MEEKSWRLDRVVDLQEKEEQNKRKKALKLKNSNVILCADCTRRAHRHTQQKKKKKH